MESSSIDPIIWAGCKTLITQFIWLFDCEYIIGEFGRYQWIQYLFLVMPAFTCGIHELSQEMVGATPTHK